MSFSPRKYWWGCFFSEMRNWVRGEVWHYGFAPDGHSCCGTVWSTPFFWLRKVWKLLIQGWPEDDTWCLQYPLAVWVLPRLQNFRANAADLKQHCGRPASILGTDRDAIAEWLRMLDEMIFACKFTIWDDGHSPAIEKEMGFSFDYDAYWKNGERAIHGWKLFGEWLPAIWE